MVSERECPPQTVVACWLPAELKEEKNSPFPTKVLEENKLDETIASTKEKEGGCLLFFCIFAPTIL
jgi:hypothetical protein